MDSLFQDEHINHDSPPSPNILIVPPEARGGHLFSVIWLSPSFRVFIINVNWELSLPGFWPNTGARDRSNIQGWDSWDSWDTASQPQIAQIIGQSC